MKHCSSFFVYFSRRHAAYAVADAIIPLLAFFFLLFPCFSSLTLPPQHFLLAPPVVSARDGDLLLNLSLTVDNEDGLRDLLKDGAALRMRVSVAMTRERSWWIDQTVVSREYDSILRHNPLSRDSEITFPSPDGEQHLKDRNLTRLMHGSWRKLSLPVVPLRSLQTQGSGGNFEIVFTLSLRHAEVPPWLEKGTFFWSSDVIPQEKRSLPFSLPVEAASR